MQQARPVAQLSLQGTPPAETLLDTAPTAVAVFEATLGTNNRDHKDESPTLGLHACGHCFLAVWHVRWPSCRYKEHLLQNLCWTLPRQRWQFLRPGESLRQKTEWNEDSNDAISVWTYAKRLMRNACWLHCGGL